MHTRARIKVVLFAAILGEKHFKNINKYISTLKLPSQGRWVVSEQDGANSQEPFPNATKQEF